MLCAPAAESARGFAGEARRLHHRLQLLRQLLPVFVAYRRSEADVIQQTLVVVEAEQPRADKVFLFEIAKACDDAIRGALLLNFCTPVRLPD